MVCLGNICRSPLAEGILRQKIAEHELSWQVESAGTGAYHLGEPPDHRSIAVAKDNDIDITTQVARKLRQQDVFDFDYILAMDTQNYRDVKSLANGITGAKIELILNYLYPGENRAVPDPYFGGPEGFENVYALLDEACDAFIKQVTNQKN